MPSAEAAEVTDVVADAAPVEPVRLRTLDIGTGQVF
jgi:signal transduction protein with GAF and PtsI domain